MTSIESRVRSVCLRQQRQRLWKGVSWGLLVSGGAGCLLVATAFFLDRPLAWGWFSVVLLTGPAIGLASMMIWPSKIRDAARAIDQSYHLKDRIGTALRFLSHPEKQTGFHQLQLADADQHLMHVDPKQVAPIKAPREWAWGLLVTIMAVGLGVLSNPKERVQAAPVQNDVVLLQALSAEESLEELKQFNEEDADPEVEKLLQELAEKIEELKQPGTDPKEALAKLSEMEAALQEQRQQLADPNTETALQSIGEALQLAEPLAAAGAAMSLGEMEQAADELAKLEMPKLDRQTERALTEKLDQTANKSGGGSKRQLQKAASQISQGLGQGDRSRFKDGMQKLAGECRKQGRRKRLADLLRKQCQCLSECKGQCQAECKSNSESKKKGGKNWGLAASGNEPGEKTAKLASPNEMKITGQESESGDVDVETMSSPEQEQAAVRAYRQQAQKYEQLSESVLDSEPIPLGHRQTIRRYFEMIHPSQAEQAQLDQ